MTIRHFEIFQTVCALGSITAAAGQLNMTQPAVSTAVRELESFYGTPLFERRNRRIYLTEAGGALLQYTGTILTQYQESVRALREESGHPLCRFGVNVTIGEESGTLGFCLSHQAIEPFMKMLNTRIVFPGKSGNKAAAQSSKQMNSIIGTSVEVSCDFNTTEAAVKDILNLREGDVIQLRHKVDEPLIIRCQQVPKFCASVGTYKNHMAAKILDIVKGDEEIE